MDAESTHPTGPDPIDADAVTDDALTEDAAETEPKAKKGKKGGKKSKLGSNRGVETMFRTSYRTHINLSSLADTKANIMISINGLILSFLFLSEAFSVSSDPLLDIPTGVFLVTCFVSMAFAIASALPDRRRGDWRPRSTTWCKAMPDCAGIGRIPIPRASIRLAIVSGADIVTWLSTSCSNT